MISVVTSLYKSEQYIEEFHRRTVAAIKATGIADYEIILVNDASPDRSLETARRLVAHDPYVTVIDLSRNFGQHKAILTGLARSKGDWVFVLDSDLEEEPEWLTRFFAEIQGRSCDVVYGFNTNPRSNYLYSVCRRAFYRTLDWLSPTGFPENLCTARLMSRRYVKALLSFPEREIFMAGVWHMAGFTQCPIEVVKHDSSPSSYSTLSRIRVFVDSVTAYSTRPLVAISIAGIALSIVAFGYVCAIAYLRFAREVAVEGWASVMGAVLLVGGISMFFNGVIAIYVAKIFIEVKQRPRTIIGDIYGGDSRGAEDDSKT